MEPAAFAPSYSSQAAYTLPCGAPGFSPEVSHIGSGTSSGKESLEILSAESYDDGTGMSRAQQESEVRRRVLNAGLPFGLNDEERRETESGEQVSVGEGNEVADDGNQVNETGKKRKRKQKAPEALSADEEADAGKRARGRPRVDTKDETPTEVCLISCFCDAPISLSLLLDIATKSILGTGTLKVLCRGPVTEPYNVVF
jgi:hypothetical protein